LSGAEVVEGKAVNEIGSLSGYSRTATGSFYGNLTTFENAPAKKKVSWIIKGNADGQAVTVKASHEKSGSAVKIIEL
jgi:hypothetical protein